MLQVWLVLDKDNSGAISADEFSAFLKRGGRTEEDAAASNIQSTLRGRKARTQVCRLPHRRSRVPCLQALKPAC